MISLFQKIQAKRVTARGCFSSGSQSSLWCCAGASSRRPSTGGCWSSFSPVFLNQRRTRRDTHITWKPVIRFNNTLGSGFEVLGFRFQASGFSALVYNQVWRFVAQFVENTPTHLVTTSWRTLSERVRNLSTASWRCTDVPLFAEFGRTWHYYCAKSRKQSSVLLRVDAQARDEGPGIVGWCPDSGQGWTHRHLGFTLALA